MAYVTIEEAATFVGSRNDMRAEHITMAQAVIEAYTGRSEARVTDPDDLAALKKATAYQAVYMATNTDVVFEEPGFSSLSQDGFGMTSDNEDSPMIAPMARIACKSLSWFRSRSITTAPQKRVRRLSWWYE